MLTLKELHAATGGLSNPSKMPGYAYGIPSEHCILGSILRKAKGTPCSTCYTFKGFYKMYPAVAKAQENRFEILMGDMNQWADDMMQLIERKLEKLPVSDHFFRWHDAGDIQSVEHLIAIADIAVSLPWIQFWLPTQQRNFVAKFDAEYDRPKNLVIRISSTKVGQKQNAGTLGSTIDTDGGFNCTAPLDDKGNELPTNHPDKGKCRDCRACWDPKIETINYKKH